MFLESRLGTLNEPLTGRTWNEFAILGQLSHRMGYYNSHGLNPTDRVFLYHGNTMEFFVDLLAIWNLGGCAIPIDSRLTRFEIETLARHAKPKFCIVRDPLDSEMTVLFEDLQIQTLQSSEAEKNNETGVPNIKGDRVILDQPALILFTSGSTGQPKGVVHTHRTLRARWFSLKAKLDTNKFRRTLCLLPTHFGHGLICNSLFPWLSGHDLFILPPFKPEVVMQLGEILDRFQITFMSSVPSVWQIALKMAKAPASGSLQLVFCGSAPLSASVWKDIQQWTGTRSVFNSYGITETGSWVAGTSVPDFQPEDGLIGEPWGAVIKILKSSSTDVPLGWIEECKTNEPGYVWLNTPALMTGYLEREDLTKQVVNQGWFMTGDIGLLDDRGLLYLRGREREEINKGGMKVYPADIDAVVERFAGTVDTCCFGFDNDPLYGQNVGLAVVLKEKNDQLLYDLYLWIKKHLAKHQMPVRWYIVDEIPRTSRGKVNRSNVADACSKLDPVDPQKAIKNT